MNWIRTRRRRRETHWRENVPDYWEERAQAPTLMDQPAKPTVKTRKPVVITNWFGIETSSDSEEATDEEKWSEVERKRKSTEKKKKMLKKKQQLKRECATKAAHMASIGPISSDSVNYFMNKDVNFEQAKVCAVRELLAYNLGYEDDVLEQLDIKET